MSNLKTYANHLLSVNLLPEFAQGVADTVGSPDDVSKAIQLLTTIVTSAAALWQVFKKRKPKTP